MENLKRTTLPGIPVYDTEHKHHLEVVEELSAS